jgi:hypothetical protein
MRFFAPLTYNEGSPLTPGLPHPVRSTYRFSQPLSGLLLPAPRSHVSCFNRLWGFALQRLPLPNSSGSSSLPLPLSAFTVNIGDETISDRPTPESIVRLSALKGLTRLRVRSQRPRCYPTVTADPLLSFLPSKEHHQTTSTRKSLLSCD